MYEDEGSTKESLNRMIRRITPDGTLREDLLQEALIHLWMTEARRPSQTRSWYLQSCKYHLLHYLASGRSVDSAKRRGAQLDLSHVAPEDQQQFDHVVSDNSVLGWVSARDIMSLLAPQLQPHERAVLDCFAEGLGPREIGRKLKMSHTMVIKHRRKIASLFNKLEVVNASVTVSGNGANGFKRASGRGRWQPGAHHSSGRGAVLQLAANGA